MNDISQLDKNFAIRTSIDKEDVVFYDVKAEPFQLYGVFYEENGYARVPQAVAKQVSDGVCSLSRNTAGGRVRFKTNSPYVAISTKMPSVIHMTHMTLCGSSGYDLYVKDRYYATFQPPFEMQTGYESVMDFHDTDLKEITINFPLYNDVSELYVGIKQGSLLQAPEKYTHAKPIVYYGSSITQGGCASRPGNSYQAIISRALDTDYINLGFSGNAKGEKEISDYIQTLDMSIFVYDYDHNAPSVEHLQNTHARMFSEIRSAKPHLPIIMLSRPNIYLDEKGVQRRSIIEFTYHKALENGDSNVYYIDGQKIFERFGGDSCTVDGCHPNDLGFMCMAHALIDVLKKLL